MKSRANETPERLLGNAAGLVSWREGGMDAGGKEVDRSRLDRTV